MAFGELKTKKSTVLVIGVFNILHPGHIRLLRFAKECASYLVVAIQSDSVVGGAALIPEKYRLENVLLNIFVDEAFITDEDPVQLVDRIRPNVLVKGKEHESKENEEAFLLESYGGELLFDSGGSFFSDVDLLRREFYANSHCKLPSPYMDRHNITSSQLSKRLEYFSELKVMVLGDLIMDEYITCNPLGMSQEDPTIVVTPIDNQLFVGGAGVVASHAASLGAEVDLISITGEDDNSNQALKMLEERGVNANLIGDQFRPTTLKQRFRTQGQTLLRVSHLHQNDISQKLQDQFFKTVESLITKIDLLVFSDFNYGCLPSALVDRIVQLAMEQNIYCVADSQSSSQIGDISRFKNMELITPTEREARIAANNQSSGLVVLSELLRHKAQANNILLKLGEEGVLIHATDNGGFLTDRIDALNNSPKDVAGAGDSMLIVASMALKTGATIWEAALLGSIGAAIQVSRVGNKPLSIQELQSAIKS